MTEIQLRLTTALADSYRVMRELGAGGMATVYLAHDLKHERDVAIKVLHPDLGAALGADRFLSEIKTTARLQHPHILPLLDSGAADGLLYYVMPYVRGETLRARLERERQLPIDDALRIAREVASALEHAHRQGIIHRDIKPENILLQDGAAVVADFGIALAVQSAGGARMTQTGLSLGTPQYMSPEQAMGERTIDARSDIYALGAVTYEMLAGDPPFTGSSVQGIVAKVLTERPTPLRTVRDTVSEVVDIAVLRALAKLPADRFTTAVLYADALVAAGTRETESSRQPARTTPAVSSNAGKASVARTTGLIAITAALAIAGTRYVDARAEDERENGTTRFVIQPPRDERFASWIAPLYAISPDGRTLVYSAEPQKGVNRLLRRPLDRIESTPIDGSEGGTTPAFSPDGSTLAFHAPGGIFTVPVSGGSPSRVVSMDWARGIAWTAPDVIVFGRDSSNTLFRVSPSGGPPVPFGAVPEGWSAWWPVGIRGTDVVLFSASSPRGDTVQLYAASLADDRAKPVGSDGVFALGVLDGSLLYANASGDLLSAPFDLRTHRVSGDALRHIDDVGTLPLTVARGLGGGALSTSGDLVYREHTTRSQLLRAQRDGRTEPLLPDTLQLEEVRLSPDGARAALTIQDAQAKRRAISVLTLATGVLSRLTPLDASVSYSGPQWTADGKSIVYRVNDDLRPYVAMRSADGSGAEVIVRRGGEAVYEFALAPDGVTFVGRLGRALQGGQRLAMWSLADTTQRPQAYMGGGLRISPDGRSLAHIAPGENRTAHLFVRTFPKPGPVVQVDRDGIGDYPAVWARDGRTLYYGDQNGLAAASMQFSPTLAVVGTNRLFSGTDFSKVAFDVAPDGSFLLLKPLQGDRLAVVRNVMAEVRAQRAAHRQR